MPETCSVAIVGAGYTAREHIKAFQSLPHVRIAGITSRTRAKAEALAAEFKIPLVVDTVAELHARTNAQLVVVTVPELSMNAVAKQAFAFPWTVFTEKPLGYDLPDALDIQAAAKSANRKVFVALNRRMIGATLTVIDQLAGSDAARFIKVQDQESQARALAAGQPKKVVDNWMYANAVHLIDYFRFLGRGRVTEVVQVLPFNPDAPGPTVALLRYESGDLGLYEGIWHGPGPWAVSTTITGRRWELRPVEQLTTQVLGSPAETVTPDPRDKDYKPGFALQAEVVTALALGGTHPRQAQLASLDESVETMRLVARIFGHAGT
jgi:predicted dehydrogenase